MRGWSLHGCCHGGLGRTNQSGNKCRSGDTEEAARHNITQITHPRREETETNGIQYLYQKIQFSPHRIHQRKAANATEKCTPGRRTQVEEETTLLNEKKRKKKNSLQCFRMFSGNAAWFYLNKWAMREEGNNGSPDGWGGRGDASKKLKGCSMCLCCVSS